MWIGQAKPTITGNFRFVQPILTFGPTVIVGLLMYFTVTLIEYLRCIDDAYADRNLNTD